MKLGFETAGARSDAPYLYAPLNAASISAFSRGP